MIDHKQHLKSLDGLRGLAIMMVFFFHYYPRSAHDPIGLLAGTGWTGVDMFFVLSGFLITGILYDTLSQKRYFVNFYARRALRLFPVYFLLVGVVIAFAPLLGGTHSWWDIPFFIYGSNIVADLYRVPHLGDHIDMGHLWSLALEEQFYIFWAPAVFYLRTARRILIFCFWAALFSIVLRIVLSAHPVFSYTPARELPTRLDGLLCGGAVAIAMRTESGARWLLKRRPLLNGVAVAGVATFCICILAGHSSFPSTFPIVAFGYIATTALFTATIALAVMPGTWASRLGSAGVLRIFGRYSYGLYLFHEIPYVEFSRFTRWTAGVCRFPEVGGLIGVTLLFALTLGVAALSYHGFELFFLRMKRHFGYDDERKAHRMATDQDTTVSVT